MQRILYIEDNEVDSERLKRLSRDRFDVCVAPTMGDGLSLLNEEEFDCIMLDLSLPDSPPDQTLGRCLNASGLPVVVLTGHDDPARGAQHVRNGAQDFLPKSKLDAFALERVVRYAIDRHEFMMNRVEEMERWAQIIEAMSETVILAEDSGRVTWMNRCHLDDQANPERWYGKHLSSLLNSDIESTLRTMRNGTPKHVEFMDEGRVFDSRLAPAPQGGTLVTIREITKQRELERELNRSQRLAAVGTLAGGIAHDFNNLLTVVVSLTRLVLEVENVSDDAREDLEQVLAAAHAASSLVDQLLTFARRERTTAEIVDVAAEMLRIKAMVSRLISAAGIDLNFSVPDRRVPVQIDVAHLEQIIVNLIVNSIKASSQGGTIDLYLTEVGDSCRIIVSDDGCGMPQEVAQRLFEPFFTTRPEQGTGLGLSTVYGIIESCGGAIDFESELGSGTRFEISLPLAAHSLLEESSITMPEALGLNGLRVLLVEDRGDVRYALLRSLTTLGASVVGVESAAEALEQVERDDFDVVISDVMLGGGGDGILLVDRIAESSPQTPVLLISGNLERPQLESVGGNVVFLRKPFTQRQLVKELTSLTAVLPRGRGSA